MTAPAVGPEHFNGFSLMVMPGDPPGVTVIVPSRILDGDLDLFIVPVCFRTSGDPILRQDPLTIPAPFVEVRPRISSYPEA